MEEDVPDSVLMERYLDGDQDAFRAIYELYAGRLRRALRKRVRDDEVAGDLVQQTFLRLHRSRADFKRGHSPRPWLYTITFNLARDWGRVHGRRIFVEWDERDFPIEAVDIVEAKDQIRRVRDALNELSDDNREVIELHWFEGLSFAEISDVTGASRSSRWPGTSLCRSTARSPTRLTSSLAIRASPSWPCSRCSRSTRRSSRSTTTATGTSATAT